MRQLTMKVMIFLISFMSIGCGWLKPMDPELKDIVRDFEDTYKTEVNFPVHFDDPEHIGSLIGKEWEGICQTFPNKRVRVSNHLEGDKLRAVVYHELGHCKFDVSHDNSMIKFGDKKIPKSMMHPTSGADLFGDHKELTDYYKEELRAKFIGDSNVQDEKHLEHAKDVITKPKQK